MNNKKILIITSLLIMIAFIFGLSFALYTYNKTSSNSKLIVGDIYMHYKENKDAILTTAEDTSRFYYDGYLVNSNMKTQSYTKDTRNELSKCMDYLKYFNFDSDSTVESFCKGTGTLNGLTFQEIVDSGYLGDDYLVGAGIISSDKVVNSNMKNQTYTSDTRNELSKCAEITYNYYLNNRIINPTPTSFNNKQINKKFISSAPSYTFDDFVSFCQGKKIIDGGALSNEYNYYPDSIKTDLNNLNIVNQYKGILSNLETSNFILNEDIKNQEYQTDTRNELSLCADYFYQQKYYSSLSEHVEYCKGDLDSFQDDLTNFESKRLSYLTSKNIIIESGDTYIVNSNMKNQEYQSDARNELSKCMDFNRDFTSDDESTAETFCKGTGTYLGQTIYDNISSCSSSGGGSQSSNKNNKVFVLPILSQEEPSFCSYYKENNIIIEENKKLSYFEFTVDGKNTSNKDIIYNVKLVHGDVVSNKTESNRINDKFLIFKLVEVVDNNEVELVNDKSFTTINNNILYSNKVLKNTNSEIKHTYRLYMVVNPNLVVGNTDRSDYSFDEYANLFASIKVNVTGDYE